MRHDSPTNIAPVAATPVGSLRAHWGQSLVIALGLFIIYMSNNRDLGTFDTVAATILPLNIVRGHGVFFDHFVSGPISADRKLPHHLTVTHGHLVTPYPIGPALIAVPFFLPQVAINDWRRPGWDRDPRAAIAECIFMAKLSMAAVVALAGFLLHRLLFALGTGWAATPAVIAAGLGSDLWVIGSQNTWQHGPAALLLVVTLCLLLPWPVARWRVALAGVSAGMLVVCRLMDAVFALAVVVWLARVDVRSLRWFLPAPILIGACLLTYNLWLFGSVFGGQALLEQNHMVSHAISGTWSTPLIEGLLGTLASPNRGLLIFSPWVAIALGALGARSRLAKHSLLVALLVALVPYTFILAKYSVWWGGHCFGPRYWTDLMPLFAILFAFALEWIAPRSFAFVVIAILAVLFSTGVQAIGAFCYPSSWNLKPRNVDLAHERLWDWRDSEVSRAIWERFGGEGQR